jgi:hypothetical protein
MDPGNKQHFYFLRETLLIPRGVGSHYSIETTGINESADSPAG